MLASRRWASGYQIIDHPIWCQRRRLIWRVRMSDNPQENRVLKEGEAAQHIRGMGENRTGILKKGYPVLREPTPDPFGVRFAFVHDWRHIWRIETICRVTRVSTRGYRSWRSRPMSQRDRTDMKVLAHIREQSSLSHGSYGRPRMTMELKEVGLAVGERRVGG